MKNKLLDVKSTEYDKAEATAFFHAVVAPVLVSIVAYFIISIRYAIISGLIYTLLMSILNLYREFDNDAFLEEKSRMYFEYLKYLFGIFFLVVLYMFLTTIGGSHV
jgi:hypothetical protein